MLILVELLTITVYTFFRREVIVQCVNIGGIVDRTLSFDNSSMILYKILFSSPTDTKCNKFQKFNLGYYTGYTSKSFNLTSVVHLFISK